MRSYFYWVDSVMHGTDVTEALYHKVIYKITTDNKEISLLEQALREKDLISELKSIAAYGKGITNGEELEICADGDFEAEQSMTDNDTPPAVALKRAKDSKGISDVLSESTKQTDHTETGEDGTPIYHELSPACGVKKEEEQTFRKHLNKEARNSIKGSIHEKIGMIVHRPAAKSSQREEYDKMVAKLFSVIRELTRKTKPLLEYETSANFLQNRVYGTMFHAEKTAPADFKYFSQKTPPEERPSLSIGVRINQSGSMSAFGRLEAAKQAAVAVYEFCRECNIPVIIYGDTADRSPKEKMSIYAYIDWEKPKLNDGAALMGIESISNNRDGMALYSRKGIYFLAAAIGEDKEMICEIYGQEHFLNITDLKQLPLRLVQTIARFI